MKIVDLTLGIFEGMKIYPLAGYTGPKISLVLSPEKDPLRKQYKMAKGLKASALYCLTHTGTHIDAPDHLSFGKTIDQIDLETFVGDALIIDVSSKKEGEAITVQDLEDVWKGLKGVFEEKPVNKVIIKTGWTSRKLEDPDYFENSPYLTKESAEWLVKKGFKLVGLDFQTDRLGGVGRPVHETFLGNDVCIIEYLTNTEKLSEKKTMLIALPLKLIGTEGSPARVIAIEE